MKPDACATLGLDRGPDCTHRSRRLTASVLEPRHALCETAGKAGSRPGSLLAFLSRRLLAARAIHGGQGAVLALSRSGKKPRALSQNGYGGPYKALKGLIRLFRAF